MKRVDSIKKALECLSINMKKKSRTIPDSIITKLVLIRSCLLNGEVVTHHCYLIVRF